MAEEKTSAERSRTWQELTPAEIHRAVAGGFAHYLNNTAVGLAWVNLYEPAPGPVLQNTMESLRVDQLAILRQPPVIGANNRETVALTAQWVKGMTEVQIRKTFGLELNHPDPVGFCLTQFETTFAPVIERMEAEDRKTTEDSLARVRKIWGNLTAMADPEKALDPAAPLDMMMGEEKPLFNFTADLVAPKG